MQPAFALVHGCGRCAEKKRYSVYVICRFSGRGRLFIRFVNIYIQENIMGIETNIILGAINELRMAIVQAGAVLLELLADELINTEWDFAEFFRHVSDKANSGTSDDISSTFQSRINLVIRDKEAYQALLEFEDFTTFNIPSPIKNSPCLNQYGGVHESQRFIMGHDGNPFESINALSRGNRYFAGDNSNKNTDGDKINLAEALSDALIGEAANRFNNRMYVSKIRREWPE